MTDIVKFRPSNHSQGDAFISDWCGSCRAGQPGEEPCGILARTMWLKLEDPDYPAEWRIDPELGAICTAHDDINEPPKPKRCEHTVDMFGKSEVAE